MADDKAGEIIALWERGKSDRGTFESHWQQCANYMQPDRADYTTENSPGVKRMQYVFDETPIWCHEQFIAGLCSYLTSSTLQWFWLRCEDDRINKMYEVREWCDAASASLYSIFNSPRRNFAGQSQELYGDLGLIGTAVMAVLESRRSSVLFSTRHMKECVIFENEEDRVDTLVRKWPFTARQAFGQWGAAAGEAVRRALEKTPDQKFNFYHGVRPRKLRDPQRADKLNKAFESIYVSENDKTVISEGGFEEFPYLTPRLSKSTGETYGRGRAMIALPGVKMLNEFVKLEIKGAQLVVHPMFDVPDNGYLMPIKTTPGAFVFHRAGMRPDDRITTIQTGAQLVVAHEMLEALRNRIGRIFYVDLFRMPMDMENPQGDGKGSTATYWLQRREKEMMALSPMLARSQSEYTGPLIDRTFAMCWRQSKALKFGPGAYFPPPPEALSGEKLVVEYVSPIAMAQKSSQVDSIDRLIQKQLELRTVDPESQLALDSEAIMRLTAEDLNAPTAVLKSPERMAAEREQKAAAEAAMNDHMELANVASAAKDGSAAVKNIAQSQGAGEQLQEAA